MDPAATVRGPKPPPVTNEKLWPGMIVVEREIAPPARAIALPGVVVPLTGLVATVWTALKLPKLVCAAACACPLEPEAVDCACAALPLTVLASELAFALPAVPGPIGPNRAPPIAVALASAVPPCS